MKKAPPTAASRAPDGASFVTRMLHTVGSATLTLLVVVSVVFLVTAWLPGDFASQLAGANQDAAERLRTHYELDRPVLHRLAGWWWSALHLDLGTSWIGGTDVFSTVTHRLGASSAIVLPAWILAMTFGIGGALVQAVLRGRPSAFMMSAFVAACAAIPEAIVVVLLVLLFAVKWRLLPAVTMIPLGESPWASPGQLVLPVLGLAIPVAAWVARILRGPAEELLGLPLYVSAQRRGMPLLQRLWRCVAIRMAPVVLCTAAISAVGLLGAGVVVEALLNYPGVGGLLAGALGARDMPVVQGITLVLSCIAVVVYTTTDLLSVALERRVKR